jgi:hypothetical protein
MSWDYTGNPSLSNTANGTVAASFFYQKGVELRKVGLTFLSMRGFRFNHV